MSLTICMHSWQSMSNKFYTYPTEFWCARPENLANISVEEWQNLSAPIRIVDDKPVFDRCEIFNVNYTNINERPDNNTPTISCKGWEYNTTHFQVSTYFLKRFKTFWILQFFSFHLLNTNW